MGKYTTQEAGDQSAGVNRVTTAPVPDPSEKAWVVIVVQVKDQFDDDESYSLYAPLYALSPKGGGPASLLDKATWGDKSMAGMRAAMTRDKLAKDRRSYNQTATTGFVHENRLHWSDGVPADGERRGR